MQPQRKAGGHNCCNFDEAEQQLYNIAVLPHPDSIILRPSNIARLASVSNDATSETTIAGLGVTGARPGVDKYVPNVEEICLRSLSRTKLRCPPRQNTMQPFARCVRTGKACVTGFTKPLGRGNQPVPPASSIAPAIAASQHALAPSTIEACTPTSELQSDPETAPIFIPSPLTSVSTFEVPPSASDDPLGSDWLLDGVDFGPTFNHNDLISSHISSEFSTGGNLAEPSVAYTDPLGVRSTAEQGQAIIQCDRRLSQLSIDICGQVGKQSGLAGDGHEDARSSHSTPEIHEILGSAFQSISRLIDILQAYRHDRSAMDGVDFGNLTLRLSCALNAIANYLRLATLFDRVLLALCASLQAHAMSAALDESAAQGPQLLPGLQLAGFAVQHSGFQAKILVQAVQHQFKSIERVLGLPLEFRVSESQEVFPRGLLLQGIDLALLRSLLTSQYRGAIGFDCPAIEYGRIAPLGSLRTSIERLQRLLGVI